MTQNVMKAAVLPQSSCSLCEVERGLELEGVQLISARSGRFEREENVVFSDSRSVWNIDDC